MAIRTTPRAIFEKLYQIAPDIKFGVYWEEDPYFDWDGEGPDPKLRGYLPHNVDVTASVRIEDKIFRGSKSLGGVYEKEYVEDEDIHGYLPQMLKEALEELIEDRLKAGPRDWSPRRDVSELVEQINDARDYLKEVLRVRHAKQMKRKR
jgi:predicted house-cleaning noncanonical NTP pyrophosphatase (MazG superfamily)